MQHWKLLEQVENDSIEPVYLAHTRRLLQSDLWSAEIVLREQAGLEPDRIRQMDDERERIAGAINKIEKRIEGLAKVIDST